jgi:STE24 endopeptidase
MFQLWIISLFIVLIVRDSMREPLLAHWLTPAGSAAAVLVPFAAVALTVHLLVSSRLRRLNKGDFNAVVNAELIVLAGRWVAVFLHATGVLLFGWLDLVRSLVGNVIVVDEAIALAPALIVFILGWTSFYPIERAMRESTIIRSFDQGTPIYPIPSRAQFVGLNLRHNLLLSVVPLLLILGWAEAVDRLIGWAVGLAQRGRLHGWLAATLTSEEGPQYLQAASQLIGVLGVFIVGPVVMRFLWDTKRLPQGTTRDRLLAMCRAEGIKVRELLVWRTHGSMINGAVIGLLAPARYILLTDALLDSMPTPQVEAVMAHELAHVRHHHMVWLAVVMLVGVSFAMGGGELITELAHLPTGPTPAGAAVQLAITIGAFAFAMLIFGFVSRRFEWQADAYAARLLSSQAALPEGVEALESPQGPPAAGGGPLISPTAALAMASALETVARLNHIPRHRPSWRHGSIACRQGRLQSIVGISVARLPIDSSVRKIKRVAALLLLTLIGLAAWPSVWP